MISKKSIYAILKEINNPELITDVLKSHFIFNSIDDLELALYSNDKGVMKKVVSLYLANKKKNQAALNKDSEYDLSQILFFTLLMMRNTKTRYTNK